VSRFEGMLRGFGRKARGILGLGVVGGTIAALGGMVLNLLTSLGRFGLLLEPGFLQYLAQSTANAGMTFFLVGSTVSAGFGTLLAVTSRDRAIGELPLWQMAALGAVVAGATPAAFMLAVGGWGMVVAAGTGLLSSSVTFAGFGGLLASGLVAAAKSAARREVSSGEEDRARLASGPTSSTAE